MTQDLLSSLESGIFTLTIHRPEQRNALNAAVVGGLTEALRQAGDDRAVRVVAITGTGDKVFCAGADLKTALPEARDGEAFSPGAYRNLLFEILGCPKPTVALARGHVIAGGLGLLLACDLAFACDDITISTPEIQVGMFPMMVLALLYRHLGRKQAAEMLLLGERISAPAALRFGILNRAVPRQNFEGEVGPILRKLADKSSHIVRLGKEAIERVAGRDLREDLEYLERALAAVMATADSQEGILAFLEKRPPNWRDE